MPHRVLNVAEFGVLDAYQAQLKLRNYQADAAQKLAIDRLQRLYSDLLAFKAARRSALRKLFARPTLPQSVYLWGGVGRGKSFIMDCFFEAVPYQRKRRVHFHAFMQSIHVQLREAASAEDPLSVVADAIAKKTRLLCFDEFHVSDIADAMMLGRLLEALFERGVVFVMTSNYPPDGLYPNGLQRQNFLPTIALMKQHFDVLEVDVGTDYRLRSLERMDTFIVPAGAEADQSLAEDFAEIAGVAGKAKTLNILGRGLPARRVAPGVVWFDFSVLCEGPRSQNDYLALAQEYHTLLLSSVPVMNAQQSNAARRFTWLIDVLYDHRVKLVLSAEAQAPLLYTQGPNAQEFPRTVSRLIEMRTREYLAEPHRLSLA